MPILTVRIDLDLDGDALEHLGFPLTLRQSLDTVQPFAYDASAEVDDETFTALPLSTLTTVQALLYRTLKATGLRLEGGEAGSVALRLTQNGLVLILNSVITASVITVNNDGSTDSSDARLLGFGGGS